MFCKLSQFLLVSNGDSGSCANITPSVSFKMNFNVVVPTIILKEFLKALSKRMYSASSFCASDKPLQFLAQSDA